MEQSIMLGLAHHTGSTDGIEGHARMATSQKLSSSGLVL